MWPMGLELGQGEIFIGRCKIKSWADEELLVRTLSHLPVIFHAEIKRYYRIEDRWARLGVRLLLGKIFALIGLQRESTLCGWRKTVQGRPFIHSSVADFSISHSNPWVVAAVGVGCRVGVDLETFRAFEISVLAPYLTDSENRDVQIADQPEAEALRLWSLREAVLKADGRGLLAPEKSIRNISELRTSAGLPWQVTKLDFVGGCLCLASDREIKLSHQQEFSFNELLLF